GGVEAARAGGSARGSAAGVGDREGRQVRGLSRKAHQRLLDRGREGGDRVPAGAAAEVIAPLDLPDIPRWIEAHGIAADPASWRRELGAGFAVGSDSARLVVVAGDADAAAVTALAAEVPGYTMLFAIERTDLAAASRRGVVRALLHTLR